MLSYKDTELKRRRKMNYLGVMGEYLVRAAKALVVSEPIAIFHPGDGKS